MDKSSDCGCGGPSGTGSEPLSVAAAIALLVAAARPITATETLATGAAHGRVLAAALVSPIDQPGWDYSAMDGYALCAADVPAEGGWLPVSQRIAAGSPGAPLAPGSAARIFTGAPIPDGADTVVMQEVCVAEGDRVRFPENLTTGANIRRRGEDLTAGTPVISAGTVLGPAHLALAASVGAATLTVTRRPRVAVFASGDELVLPGLPLGPGQIYNSNRFLFHALLEALDCELVDLGICPDRLDATIATLRDGAGRADLVLASGGVSVGEEDHVKPAVEALGRLDLWQVAMRPGKPVAFGHILNTPFIGSPGNPVSVYVTMVLFGRPFIRRMQGSTADPNPPTLRLRAAFDWPRPDKRQEYQRARLVPGADGSPEIEVFPSRSSAALASLTWANGLVVIAPRQVIQRGDLVDFIPFGGLFF